MTMLGKVVDYSDKKTDNITRIRRGTVDRIEKMGTDIIDVKTMKVVGKAFRFRLRPVKDGAKSFWTRAVPDVDGSLEKEWSELHPIEPIEPRNPKPTYGIRGPRLAGRGP